MYWNIQRKEKSELNKIGRIHKCPQKESFTY